MLQYYFLVIEENSIRLLGYPLALSPRERQILVALTSLTFATAQQIAEEVAFPLSPACIAVHVSAINRKARAISGRALVQSTDGIYRINPLM